MDTARLSRWQPLGVRSALLVALLAVQLQSAQSGGVNIDGGRSQLPGMKQDMFDQAQRDKSAKGRKLGKGPPDCPKSDHMSPFHGLAFVSGEIFVKVNGSEGKCSKLVTVGGANFSTLANASRTCGPVGEWKKRMAEELSAVFFQAGLEWVKHEDELIEVVTEDGTYEIPVTEARYNEMSECWARGCECEQAKNPMGKAILITLMAIGIGGLLFDSFKAVVKSYWGEKPPKHVSYKGHRLEEVKYKPRHACDVCGKLGTSYQAVVSGQPYDMCKVCYKEAKKKLKAQLEDWYNKNPEDKAKDEAKKAEKKKKGDADSEAEGKDSTKGADSEAEGKDSTKGADSEAEGAKATSESGRAESEDKAESGNGSEVEAEGEKQK